jgi:hypothetical protein
MRNVLISVVLVALTGCAATDTKTLKASPSKQVTVTINENYQRVYKNILDKMTECQGEGIVGLLSSMQVKHTMLPDLKEAEISYTMSNLGSTSYFYHAELRGTEDGKTRITVYSGLSTWNKLIDRSLVWARDPNASCRL